MAPRPAKRQRRTTVVRSDDSNSDEGVSSPPLQQATQPASSHLVRKQNVALKPTTPRKRKLKGAPFDSSPKSSPEKVRKTDKKPVTPNKSLHSFFGRATEEQRWKRKSDTPELDTEDYLDDNIVDDEIVDDEVELQAPESSNASKSRAGSVLPNLSQRLKHETSVSSQKFVKPPVPLRTSASAGTTEQPQPDQPEHKPWADRYAPQDLEELAVHKKKVGDVQKWVQDALAGRGRNKLLVLKGPAGSGKTSTISLLAKAQGLEVISWHNRTVSEQGNGSNVQQFAEFLNRGGDFDALSFDDSEKRSPNGVNTRQRLLLIEEFPATNNRALGVTNTFRSVLQQYLSSGAQATQIGQSSTWTQAPVVMIISETLISSSTALTDSFTAHRLLGPDISNHPSTTVLEFNPVAPTFVQKALDIVVRKEARDSKRRRMPGTAVLQQLADIGDIRSAINSLEFFCARGDDGGDWSGTVASRSKKKENVPLTTMEKETLKLVSQRESTLDMFHATGKIVYNKREDPRVMDTRAQPPPRPPDHLLYLYNPKASQVDVDALLNETGTDIQTFIAALHENYVLSCNGDDFVDAFDGCAEILSVSDLLNPETRSLIRAKGNSNAAQNITQVGNSDMLKQDEISFQTACRGLLSNLPYPVHRAVPPGTRKQDAFKMFYPGSLRLWKPAEEIYDLVVMYVNRDFEDLQQFGGSHGGSGVSSWRSRGFNGVSAQGQDDSAILSDNQKPASRAITSKDNYALEVLPYRAKIHAARHLGDTEMLKKITQVRGINMSSADVEEGEEDLEAAYSASATTTALETDRDQKSYSRPLLSARSGSLRPSLGQRIQAAHDTIQMRSTQQSSLSSSSTSTASITSRKLGAATLSASFSHNPGSNGQNSDPPTTLEKLYISDDDIQDD